MTEADIQKWQGDNDVVMSVGAYKKLVKLLVQPPQDARDARFKRIAELVSSIYAHGGFYAETFNERQLEAELRAAGMFFKTPQEYSAAIAAQGGEQ